MRALLATVFALVTLSAQAEPHVLHDTGRTVDIAPYLERLNQPPPAPSRLPNAPQVPTLEDRLPITTPELAVGRLRGEISPEVLERLRYLPRPFFLVGTDEHSVRWLRANRVRLTELDAIGMVIEADSVRGVKRITDTASGLPLTIASGSDLAEALGIRHYPALITREGITQ